MTGDRVQDDARKCAKCDFDALPGSRFCRGHSDLRFDGGTDWGAADGAADRSPGTVGNLLRRARAKLGVSW